MRKFRFKLMPVLSFKKRKEDLAKKALALVVQQMMTEKQMLEQVHRERIACENALKDIGSKRIMISEVLLYQKYMADLKRREAKHMTKINMLAMHVEEKRAKLVVATKERKVLEKLEAHQRDRFTRRLVKDEQTLLDEISVNQFIYQNMR